jgi:type VI secretion system protein ImpL
MIALKDSLEKSLQTRAGVKASGLDRLAMPWFMLVGTEGSGKKSLLASTGLPLPYGPPVEVDSARKDAGRWWLFEEAVVVEAPTAKPTPKAPAPHEVTAAAPAIHLDTSEGWNNLLHLLRRERPDSPLNGIIVTVSCADLVGTRRKSPEEISEQAELLKAFLEKTRKVLGVRLPIHLIITRCDVLPGFRSFAETLPDARRDDIFGWANPAPIEKPFDPAAVDAGFVALRKSLEALHDELLAAPETVHDADGLFVFVSEFADVQDPLRDFVTKLMPSGERRPSLFFRGVYFTGDASEFAAKAAKIDDEAATLHISIEATEAESHSLVFLRSLFTNKIFKEAGLARTAARLRISRDVRVIIAQAAAILIAVLGGVGLWASINGVHSGDKVYARGLRAGAADLTRALAGVAIDLDELKRAAGRSAGADSMASRRAKDAAVISLVAEMRSVSPDRVRSPFVPWSLVSPLSGEINRTMATGVQDLVLPVIRQRLVERVNQLMGAGPRSLDAVGELDPSDPSSLTTYLKDVRALNRNIARYNSLAKKDSGQVSDLTGLMDYLFSQRPADSLVASTEFQNALKVGAAPLLIVTATQASAVVSRSVRVVALITDSAARQLSSRAAVARPDADLDALRRLHELALLTDSKKGIVATISDSSIQGLRIAREVRDSIASYLGYAAVRVLRDTLPTAAARQRLESVLSGLFSLRLLEPGEGREVDDDLRAGQNLRWDVGQLELAFALRSEQLRANISTGEALPVATAARLKTAFGQQMRSRVIDLAASAQRFTPDASNGAAAIQSETENLEAASTRLVRLSRLLDTLNASSTGKRLLAAGARQAEHVLALSQAILDSANYLAPHPLVVAAWRGGSPIGYAALGIADSAGANFRVNREHLPGIVGLAGGADPAIRYLRQSIIGPGMVRVPKLLADWIAIEASVGKFNATDFSSSAFALRDYIMLTMGALDEPTCRVAAARPDTLHASPDWFVNRRHQFRAALIGRCGATGSAQAIADYQKLRGVFVAKLAGHFPFVDAAKAATAPDADPAAVREFYALYDAFAKYDDIVLRSDPRVGPGARTAFTFLDQVAQARPFFAPFIDSAMARRSPEYAFVVQPADAPKGSSAAVSGAQLVTGVRSLLIDDNSHEGIWGFGEAVKVIPAGGDASAKPAFVATGWWGLVELAALQKDVVIRIYHPDTKVPLTLPIFPQVAPDIPLPPRGR